jgi:hypothetical protein
VEIVAAIPKRTARQPRESIASSEWVRIVITGFAKHQRINGCLLPRWPNPHRSATSVAADIIHQAPSSIDAVGIRLACGREGAKKSRCNAAW